MPPRRFQNVLETRRVTLKELASHLGLSITTVSRALAGYDDVSAATRRRVVEAARRLGYRPDPLGQRLRKGRTEAVGLVIPTPPGHFGDPFFLELAASLGESLQAHGLDLLVTACAPGPSELECYRRLVEGRRVDALVLARTRRHDERIRYLASRGVPFVCHGRSELALSFPYLDVDGEQGFLEATRHLIRLGHRRIGLINAPPELNFSRFRARGYARALEEAGIAWDDALVVTGDLTEEGGYRAARELLARPGRPTAVLCANDWMAIGAMHAAREEGMQPGEDLAVIGYDDIPVARFTHPPLTTLRQPIREAGRRLTEMLVAFMAGTPAEALQEVWVPELVVRGSDGPPRAPAADRGADKTAMGGE